MTPFRSCAAFVFVILAVGATHGAEPKRSREFSNTEAGMVLQVRVNVDGDGRTTVATSLRNKGKNKVVFWACERRGVPCSLRLFDSRQIGVPLTDVGRAAFGLPSGGEWIGVDAVLEEAFVLEESFVCERAEEPLTLVAERWLLDEKQNRWIRLEVTVPDVRRAVERNPMLTDD